MRTIQWGWGVGVASSAPETVMLSGQPTPTTPGSVSDGTYIPPSEGYKHIVYAEDESHVARPMIRLMERAGYTIHHVGNGQEALGKISELGAASVYGVVTDGDMPGMSGFDLIRKLKSLYPTLPILLLTSRGAHDKAISALLADGVQYFQKPVSVNLLVEALNTMRT